MTAKLNASMPATKTKVENPFKLGAAVALLPRTGLGKTGQILKLSRSLLKVKWDDGQIEYFGRAGQPFYGKVDKAGEAIRETPSGKPIENLWGTDEDPHLTIATDSIRQTLAEKRKKSEKLKAERHQEQVRRESDPAYQKRQADLKRYAELLQATSGSVENSWNDHNNFRIELENIPPEQMDELITAITAARRK